MPQTVHKSAQDIWCRACLGEKLFNVGSKNGFSLQRCAACGTVVVDPYPDDATLQAFYSRYSRTDSYLSKKNSKLRRSHKRVKRMLRSGAPGKTFLDVGCSVGFVTVAAYEQGLEAHGIDIDAEAIKIAQENFQGQGIFEAISIQELAKRGNRYDMIYLSEVIEHVNDPENFLDSISTLLKPGGLLYLTAPDAGHFRVPANFMQWEMVTPPNHLTYFTRRGLKKILARHGLKAERFDFALKPGMKVFIRKQDYENNRVYGGIRKEKKRNKVKGRRPLEIPYLPFPASTGGVTRIRVS